MGEFENRQARWWHLVTDRISTVNGSKDAVRDAFWVSGLGNRVGAQLGTLVEWAGGHAGWMARGPW